jgi:hypothetical protein
MAEAIESAGKKLREKNLGGKVKMRKTTKTMNTKTLLGKYLLGGAVVGALAMCPMAAHAQDGASANSTVQYAEPTLVTGTVGNYYVDRSGFVTAMSVNTANGTEYVRFSPSKAESLYQSYPVGSTINVWVTPGTLGNKYWDARGLGVDKPTVWMPVNMTRDYEWLNSEPYVLGPNMRSNWHGTVDGNLKGVVMDNRGDVVGLIVSTDKGNVMVRVPPELRQNARGYIGTNRVAPLIQGARIHVTGTPEAPRLGTLSHYPWRVAADTISVNGKQAGAIGIQMLPAAQRNALIDFSIGGDSTDTKMLDSEAARMGYMIYQPGQNTINDNGVTMTNTATQQATGRVMIVTADGQLLPVVKMNRRIYVTAADGTNMELLKVNGKYVVPASMTGARMQMVMSDGRRMEMDTVDGQLMVVMADGSMAPVTLHTP